ncbi:MAG: TetR/AcrR family transcriptional regulator C-terminal domain-containing protein [Actinomycetota bacterium]
MADEPITTERAPLDTDRIVSVAIDLADREGVGALTMRRLADELGYRVMALYRHVANKDELLGLMVDAVAAGIPMPSLDAAPLAGIRAHTVATRDAFVRHSWAPPMWLRYMPGPHRIDHMEYLLAAFDRSGLPHDIGHHGFHAVNNHVLGYTLQAQEMDVSTGDQPMEDLARGFIASLDAERHRHSIAHVEEHLRGETESSFELVLDLILDGLVRLGSEVSD